MEQKKPDGKQIWSWVKKLGIEANGERGTVCQATVTALRKRIARRTCEQVKALVANSAVLTPEQTAELLESQARRIRDAI